MKSLPNPANTKSLVQIRSVHDLSISKCFNAASP